MTARRNNLMQLIDALQTIHKSTYFLFIPNYSLEKNRVIPTQASIPIVEKSPRSGTIARFCPLRGVFISLDSGLHRNDVLMGNPDLSNIARNVFQLTNTQQPF
jgi:hypothetical protein